MLRNLRNTVLKTTASGVLVVGALEATTHIPSEGRSSKAYHSAVDEFATPALRRLLSAEQAHNWAIEFAKQGLAPKFRRMNKNGASPSAMSIQRCDMSVAPFPCPRPSTPTETESDSDSTKSVLPLVFPNPVGLAAGFDKDGVAIKGMLEMGFGFVEIGSVTPQPQPGNPKPRMFRLTEDRAVINRYGFNSLGMEAVKQNLQDFRSPSSSSGSSSTRSSSASTSISSSETTTTACSEKSLKEMTGMERTWWVVNGSAHATYELVHFVWRSVFGTGYTVGPYGIVGLNVGKNKTSDNEVDDYVQVIRELGPLADYIVVNISSPNTPGLRDLQQQDPLRQLLQSVIEERNKLPSRYCGKRRGIVQGKDIPLLVKIAPDLTGEEMKDIADVVRSNRNTNDNGGVDGLVVCNTTISRPDWLISTKHKHEAGGLSGAPLKALSTSCIRTMYKLTNGEVPIIGVGGISSGEDVYEKLRAGASLVQLYSAMAYEGPGLVSRIQDELEELMIQNGDKSVDDIIGLDHEEIYWNRQQKQLVQQQQQQQTTA